MTGTLYSNNERWLAAEFALGVLAGNRLQLAQHKFESVPIFRNAVEAWQEQFSPMLDDITPETPPAQVWNNIETRLFGDKPDVVSLQQQKTAQRWLPIALAASVAFVVGLIPYWITRQTNENMLQQSAQLEQLLSAEQAELAQRETELNNTRSDLQARQQTLIKLEESVAIYKNQLAKVQSELNGREQQLAKAEQTIESQKEFQQSAERVMNDLKQELLAMRRDYEFNQVELQRLQSELDRQRTIYAATSKRAAELETTLAQREATLQILSSPGLAFSSLGPTSDDVFADGHVLWDKRSGKWLFYTFNLPELEQNKTYQMWFITEKEGPWSAGIFQLDAQGRGVLLAQSPPASAGTISAAAVSLEPAGGVQKPTGPIYVQGTL